MLDSDLFTETPGIMTLVEHTVHLKDVATPRRRSYQIPESPPPKLEQEVELPLQLDTVEPSTSEWCSPIVLVPNKMGY